MIRRVMIASGRLTLSKTPNKKTAHLRHWCLLRFPRHPSTGLTVAVLICNILSLDKGQQVATSRHWKPRLRRTRTLCRRTRTSGDRTPASQLSSPTRTASAVAAGSPPSRMPATRRRALVRNGNQHRRDLQRSKTKVPWCQSDHQRSPKRPSNHMAVTALHHG